MISEEALTLIEQIIEPRVLNRIQRLVLHHTWQGLSYSNIAKITDYDEGYIKDTGSKLWQLLSEALGEKVTKQNLTGIIKQRSRQEPKLAIKLHPTQDWGDAPDTTFFYGRSQTLATLSQWLTQDRCRLVAILGMGGMGKTTLAVKVAEQIQADFDYVFWRSLRDAPKLATLLTDLLRFLAKEGEVLPKNEPEQLSLLFELLRSHRCLIVLDNLEAVLAERQITGQYRPGYGDYGELLRRVGESRHQSSWLITSRESPREVWELQGDSLSVRAWQLRGLEEEAAQQLLAVTGLVGSEETLRQLVACYQGNPLALKIATSSIKSLFEGNVGSFIDEGIASFNGIRHLLQTQVERLSDQEQQVMNWLAINREPLTVEELQSDLVFPLSRSLLLETVESLQRRSLIERTQEGFTQQPVVMEYISDRIVSQVSLELGEPTPPPKSWLGRYALLKATTKDYLRQSQQRVFLAPIGSIAIANLGSLSALTERLQQWLVYLRTRPQTLEAYTVGNIINLLHQLQVDLTGFDFSHFPIWQAYLPEAKLERVNFSYAQFKNCVFAETFGGISCVAFSPNGSRLAASDTSGKVQLWDRSSGQPLASFKADLAWTWVVGFSPDNRYLATAGDDREVKLWDATTAQCLHRWSGHQQTVSTLAFHPNGTLLASGALDTTIRLWRLSSDRPEIWQGHQGRVWSVVFSPDGEQLVSGSEDCTVKIWEVQSGHCRQTLTGHAQWVKAVAISSDGQTIASGSFDGVIKLWSLATGTCLHSWQGHFSTLTAIAFSPNGRWFATASYDETVKIWELGSRQCLKTLRDHHNRVWSVVFSPDGQQLATGGDDHATRLWDLKTGQCAKTWQGHTNSILSLSLSGDQTLLATGYEDQTVKLWDLQSEQINQVLRGHSNRVLSVAFAPSSSALDPDSLLLASASADRTLKLWQIATGKCLQTFYGHQSWVWSVDFSPDGQQLLSASYDRTLKCWQMATGNCLQTLEGHKAPVIRGLFCPDGQRILSSSFDHTIKLWDSQTGNCLQTLLGHENIVWAIALHPQQPWLASGSYDRTIRIWDWVTGECLAQWEAHQAPVMSLGFSPDGTHLVSGSFDHTIKVWDVATGNCLHHCNGHSGSVSALAFRGGPDPPTTLISGSFDETLRFWDIATGETLRSLRTPRPYDNMMITGILGLNEAQYATLLALGAIAAPVEQPMVKI